MHLLGSEYFFKIHVPQTLPMNLQHQWWTWTKEVLISKYSFREVYLVPSSQWIFFHHRWPVEVFSILRKTSNRWRCKFNPCVFFWQPPGATVNNLGSFFFKFCVASKKRKFRLFAAKKLFPAAGVLRTNPRLVPSSPWCR